MTVATLKVIMSEFFFLLDNLEKTDQIRNIGIEIKDIRHFKALDVKKCIS